MMPFANIIGYLLFLGAFATPTSAHELSSPSIDYTYPEKRLPSGVSDLTATHLPSTSKIYLFGGCNSKNGNERSDSDPNSFYCTSITSEAYAFDAETSDLSVLSSMPRSRYRHAAAVVEGKIWLVGGRNVDDGIISEVDVFDPSSGNWSTPYTLPANISTSDLAAFSSGSNLFFAGGYDAEYNAVDAVYRLDTSSLTLEPMAALEDKRGDIQAVTVEGYAYVTGGFTHENNWCSPYNSAERYKIDENRWEVVDALRNERGDKALVALNGLIFAIGGETKAENCKDGDPTDTTIPLNKVEYLKHLSEPGAAHWHDLYSIPDIRFRFVAAAYPPNDVIFVFGGQKYYDTDCQCYATSDLIMSMTVKEASAAVGTSLTISSLCFVGLVIFSSISVLF